MMIKFILNEKYILNEDTNDAHLDRLKTLFKNLKKSTEEQLDALETLNKIQKELENSIKNKNNSIPTPISVLKNKISDLLNKYGFQLQKQQFDNQVNQKKLNSTELIIEWLDNNFNDEEVRQRLQKINDALDFNENQISTWIINHSTNRNDLTKLTNLTNKLTSLTKKYDFSNKSETLKRIEEIEDILDIISEKTNNTQNNLNNKNDNLNNKNGVFYFRGINADNIGHLDVDETTEFWKEYFKWLKRDLNTIQQKCLDELNPDIITDSTIDFGYSENKNPFVKFLINIIKIDDITSQLLKDPEKIEAIWVALNKDLIEDNDLLDKNNLIYNPELYKYSKQDIYMYIQNNANDMNIYTENEKLIPVNQLVDFEKQKKKKSIKSSIVKDILNNENSKEPEKKKILLYLLKYIFINYSNISKQKEKDDIENIIKTLSADKNLKLDDFRKKMEDNYNITRENINALSRSDYTKIIQEIDKYIENTYRWHFK